MSERNDGGQPCARCGQTTYGGNYCFVCISQGKGEAEKLNKPAQPMKKGEGVEDLLTGSALDGSGKPKEPTPQDRGRDLLDRLRKKQ